MGPANGDCSRSPERGLAFFGRECGKKGGLRVKAGLA
jgi:hypothetical protein